MERILTSGATPLERPQPPEVRERLLDELAALRARVESSEREQEELRSLLERQQQALSAFARALDELRKGAVTSTVVRWRDRKNLGASLLVTGVVTVILGVILHFALRTHTIETEVRLGYFFGLSGLILAIIGGAIVF